MNQLFDHFIIRVESIYDQRLSETGMEQINHAFYIEKERDRFERKLRFGIIEVAPVAYMDTNYMPVDVGVPPYKLFVGHDAIQQQVNYGHAKWQEYENYYHPGTKESFTFRSMQWYGRMVDAKVGEKVYFHPSVTEEENKVGPNLYRASADKLICVIDQIGIRVQAGHMLIEPHYETEKEKDGFIIRLENEAKLLEGTVKYIRGARLFNSPKLSYGDKILFIEDANWEYEVEGTKFYAMQEEDAFGRIVA